MKYSYLQNDIMKSCNLYIHVYMYTCLHTCIHVCEVFFPNVSCKQLVIYIPVRVYSHIFVYICICTLVHDFRAGFVSFYPARLCR